MSGSKYQWPASALGELEMSINRVRAKIVNEKAEEVSV